MKYCSSCNKKFGLLEKIHYNEHGDMLCKACVDELSESDDGTFVRLEETKPEPTFQPENTVSHTVNLHKPGWECRVVKLSIDPLDQAKKEITVDRIERVINKMGEDNWELVTIVPIHTLLAKKPGVVDEPALVFKRKK